VLTNPTFLSLTYRYGGLARSTYNKISSLGEIPLAEYFIPTDRDYNNFFINRYLRNTGSYLTYSNLFAQGIFFNNLI